MKETVSRLRSSTRPVEPGLAALLESLQPNERISVTQTVRVGRKEWKATVLGKFRYVNYLQTGLSTHRVAEDDIVVPIVHFTKEQTEEMSSVTIDEHTSIVRA